MERQLEAEVDAVSSYQPSTCDYWGGVSERSRLTWCLCWVVLISARVNELFSRGGLKQSLRTGSVHFLRRPTVITWLSVPCVHDVISLICLFLSQERRGGDFCRSINPQWDPSYHLWFTVIYSHSCCRQPLPLLSLPLCTDSQVSQLPWLRDAVFLSPSNFWGFSGPFIWIDTLSALSNLMPKKRIHQPFLLKIYNNW